MIPLLLSCCLSLGAQPPGAEQPAPLTFRVHPETTFQTLVGFGAGFNGGRGSADFIDDIQKPEDRQRAYDLLYGPSGVCLNIVRLTIWPDARPLAGNQGYDWAADPHTQAMWKAVRSVLRRTRPIIYAVPFTPPARWKDSGQLNGGGTLQPEHYREYAGYLADFLAYCHNVVGVDVDVLSPQNEPGIAAPWMSCIWSGEQLRDFLKILGPVVRARGLKTQFMLSEGTAWTGAWQHLVPTLADPAARAWLSVMASHSYGSANDQARRQFAAASARNGLPVWMSEMSLMFPPAPDDPGMNAALQLADYVHRDLVEAQACVWIYCFAIFTAKFQGSLGILAPADQPGPLHGALVVPKRFWALAHYSRFARPGWKVMAIEGPGPAQTGFVSPQGDGFAIVAVNPGPVARQAVYDFGRFTMGNVETFVTTPELDFSRVALPAQPGHRMSATLRPQSVTTFVGRLAPR